MDVPFAILKNDVPLELAKYIRDHILDAKRNGRYNTWAKQTLKSHNRCIRRLYRAYAIDHMHRIYKTRRAKQNRMSKNARNQTIHHREKSGIRIPNSTRDALLLDKINDNTKWADAITKEMNALDRLNAFIYHSPDTRFHKSDGWQYAPLRMIFDIKQEDLRHKARLVAGGHVVDSSHYTTFSSTIESLSVRLLRVIAIHHGLTLMTGDIGNAFVTAPCAEKIWTRAGPEFGDKAGSIIQIAKALYGLSTSSRAFHEFLGDTLRSLGFVPSRADQDLWYCKSQDHDGYDYLAVHVDDILIAAKQPAKYMNAIEQQFMMMIYSYIIIIMCSRIA